MNRSCIAVRYCFYHCPKTLYWDVHTFPFPHHSFHLRKYPCCDKQCFCPHFKYKHRLQSARREKLTPIKSSLSHYENSLNCRNHFTNHWTIHNAPYSFELLQKVQLKQTTSNRTFSFAKGIKIRHICICYLQCCCFLIWKPNLLSSGVKYVLSLKTQERADSPDLTFN